MNAVVDTWGRLVIHGAWQAAVVAVLMLALVRLGRRWPAPVRYGLLLVALAKFALPPILSSPTSLFSHWGPTAATVEEPAMRPVVARASDPEPGLLRMEGETPPVDLELAEPPIVFSEPAEGHQAAATAPGVKSRKKWNWKTALMIAHLLGMAAIASWLAIQWLRLHRLKASVSAIAEGPIYERFLSLHERLGLRRRVRLLIGPDDTAPCCFGLLRPVVIVPRSLAEQPSDDLDRVLAHELAHHRRGDLWVNAVQLALFVVWWFHPIYWLLHRSLRALREDCCDDLLLAAGLTAPDDYCKTILKIAALPSGAGPLAVASSMADYPHPLEHRFRRIMDGSIRRSMRLGWLGLAALVVLAVVVLPGARGSSDVDGGSPREAEQPASQAEDQASGEGILEGRVLDENGQPVAGAKIWLPLWAGVKIAARATTDRDGRFRLEASEEWSSRQLIGRSYHILVYSPGCHTALVDAYPELAGKQVGPIEVRLAREVRTPVTILDPDGHPVAGATIEPLRYLARAYVLVPEEVVTVLRTPTDENGQAWLSGLPMRNLHSLSVTADGFGCQTIRRDPDLNDGIPWRVYLRRTGSISGRIACDDKSAVSGVRLELITSASLSRLNMSTPPWLTEGRAVVVTDDEGRFNVEHLASGKLQIHGSLPENGRERLWIPYWLKLPEDSTKDVVLETRTGVLVEGDVVEQGSGSPIAGAHVHLRPYGITQSVCVTTDEKGHYSAYVAPDQTGYYASAPGYRRPADTPSRQSVPIPEGGEPFRMPIIELVPRDRPALAKVIRGHLQNERGRAVPGAEVYGYAEDDESPAIRETTDSQGDFVLRLSPDVKLRELTYTANEVQAQPLAVEIVQAAPLVLRVIDLAESDCTSITGRVVDKEGNPVQDASFVLATRLNERYEGFAAVSSSAGTPFPKTDADGRFHTHKVFRRGWQYQVRIQPKGKPHLFGTSRWVDGEDAETDVGKIVVYGVAMSPELDY